MARIKISTLNSVNSEISWASNSLLNELTDWEMKAVVGGTNGLGDIWEILMQALLDGKDSGQRVLTSVVTEAEYSNYAKRPASKTRR